MIIENLCFRLKIKYKNVIFQMRGNNWYFGLVQYFVYQYFVSGFERVLPIFVKYCLLASSMIFELCASIFSISTSLLSGLVANFR